MSTITTTAVINIRPNGGVADGVHAPTQWGDQIGVARQSTGRYLITAPGIARPSGWALAIFRDDNGDNTVRASLAASSGGLLLSTNDPASGQPMDIVHLLTVRVQFTATLPPPPPMPAPEEA